MLVKLRPQLYALFIIAIVFFPILATATGLKGFHTGFALLPVNLPIQTIKQCQISLPLVLKTDTMTFSAIFTSRIDGNHVHDPTAFEFNIRDRIKYFASKANTMIVAYLILNLGQQIIKASIRGVGLPPVATVDIGATMSVSLLVIPAGVNHHCFQFTGSIGKTQRFGKTFVSTAIACFYRNMAIIASSTQQVARILGLESDHASNGITAVETGGRAFDNFDRFQGFCINKITRGADELTTAPLYAKTLGQVNTINSDFDMITRQATNGKTASTATEAIFHLYSRFIAHHIPDVIDHLPF